MKYVASISFGKDSTAMVLRLIEEGKPLDEVVFYDTGMEFQAIYNVRDKLIPVFREHDITYTELKPREPFLWQMLARPYKRRSGGYQYGYEWCGGCTRWGTAEKLSSIDRHCKGAHQYIGVAFDEPQRVARVTENKSAPLAEWHMTEADCLRYCREHGIDWMENGIDLYDILDRVSCWCCCNKNRKELYNIWKYQPEYWERLKALQSRIQRPMKSFKSKKYGDYGNVYDMEKVFEQEEKTRQMTLFEIEREGVMPNAETINY